MLRSSQSRFIAAVCLSSLWISGCSGGSSNNELGGNHAIVLPPFVSAPPPQVNTATTPIASRYLYTLSGGGSVSGFSRVVGYRLDRTTGRVIPASSTVADNFDSAPTALTLS